MVPEVRACSGYLVITAPTGVSRQRRSPGSRPHTALGALRYVDDGTRLADELQRLPRDLEVLAFEAGCEDYSEREVDELELQGGRIYLHLGARRDQSPRR
jgi:hypothetical protein